MLQENLKRNQTKMESSKSKLPKMTRPKPATSETKKVVPSFAPRKIIRRSKSMTEMRSLTTNFSRPPVALTTNFSRPPVATASKVAVKRPATSQMSKIETGQPKVMKQAKIPDWDYKSRFQNLMQKHTKLQEDLRDAKKQLAGIEDLEGQHNHLLREHEIMQKHFESLQASEKNKTEKLKKLENVEEICGELKVKNDNLNFENVEMASTIKNLTSDNAKLLQNMEHQNSEIIELKTLLSKLQRDLADNDILRRKLHNNIQDLKGNIRVFCRVRPAVGEAEKEKLKCLLNYPDENSLEIRKIKGNINSISGKLTDCKQEFNFDYVFNEGATQAEFFEELAQLVQSAIDGYHVCVFAYGQTGSGKTYTMQGLEDPDHIGMIPRTVNLIFDTIETVSRSNWVYEVKVSFLEIYNENVRDLLDLNASHNLDICFNEGKGTTVTNLKIEPIKSYEDFKNYMAIAHKNRMVAATDFNEHSSRSHAITKIYLCGKHSGSKECYAGSINLVDLAGSESAKTSHGDRLVETKSINKSLSNLGKVMLALHNKERHVPYRNSKLTFLLQSCLGGNSKTMMIVNISPFEDNYGESLNSLRFASQVKEVRTKIKRNKAPLSPVTSNLKD